MAQLKRILQVSGWLAVVFMTSNCKEEFAFYSNVLRSDVFVQEYDVQSYDFLWVFDNSGSMKSRRDFVKDNMQTFLNTLNSRKAVDFQMAVTSTDMFSDAGALVANDNGLEVVKSTESSNPVGDFASIVNNVVDTDTSFWEQGLETAYQAIQKNGSKFVRAGVPLVVVFLTDEEDYSCADDCWGPQPENNDIYKRYGISRYIDFFSNLKRAEDSEMHIFPIVGLESGACTVASYGNRYVELLNGVNATLENPLAVSGSVCNSELEDSYNNIAQLIADRGTRFTLSKTASANGLRVYVNGALIPASTDNYFYEEETNSIIFTGAIPERGSSIEIGYSELTN